MPVNNVNFYALEKVLEAAKRYQKMYGDFLMMDDEDATLDSCIFMIESNLIKNDLHGGTDIR